MLKKPCKSCGKKIGIKPIANTRARVRKKHGDKLVIKCSNCNYLNETNISGLYAVSESNKLVSGVVVGSAIGILGGPIGVVLGGAIGAGLGNVMNSEESAKIKRFNKSL